MRKKRRNNVMYLSQIYTEHEKGWGTNFSSPFSYIFIFCSMFLRCFFAVSLLIFCFFLVFVVSLVSTFFVSSSCFSVSHRLIPICHMFFLYILLSPPWLVQCSCRQQLYFLFCGLRPFFIFVYTVFPLGVLYPEHSQPAFDWCRHCLQLRIYQARPSSGLQGPKWCGLGLLDNLF